MPEKLKHGLISLVGDSPMSFTEQDSPLALPISDEQKNEVGRLTDIFRAYGKASKRLLKEKYPHLLEFAPKHLADPGNILIARCIGGVVIRYERASDAPKNKLVCGWFEGNLNQVAALLSQNLIHCHSYKGYEDPLGVDGLDMAISIVDPSGNVKEEVSKFKIRFDIDLGHVDQSEGCKGRPFPIASVRNSLELAMHGELVSIEDSANNRQPFVTRSEIRLPVGWECIEIIPTANTDSWIEKDAENWSENDILAAIVAGQFRDAHFQSLDPNAGARKQYALVLNQFQQLLDTNPEREEELQVFLKNNPILLCPTHTRVWPKLKLGAKVTDFVFCDATGDYLLVELEKSTHSLFRNDEHPRDELNVARGQVVDWKRYIEDNLRTVQDELGLSGISSSPRSLIVIGRNSSVSSENRRKLKAMENEQPKLRIMTYDDVYENAKSMIENLLGPIFDPGGNTEIYYVDN